MMGGFRIIMLNTACPTLIRSTILRCTSLYANRPRGGRRNEGRRQRSLTQCYRQSHRKCKKRLYFTRPVRDLRNILLVSPLFCSDFSAVLPNSSSFSFFFISFLPSSPSLMIPSKVPGRQLRVTAYHEWSKKPASKSPFCRRKRPPRCKFRLMLAVLARRRLRAREGRISPFPLISNLFDTFAKRPSSLCTSERETTRERKKKE